jgi:uridine kinase
VIVKPLFKDAAGEVVDIDHLGARDFECLVTELEKTEEGRKVLETIQEYHRQILMAMAEQIEDPGIKQLVLEIANG